MSLTKIVIDLCVDLEVSTMSDSKFVYNPNYLEGSR